MAATSAVTVAASAVIAVTAAAASATVASAAAVGVDIFSVKALCEFFLCRFAY